MTSFRAILDRVRKGGRMTLAEGQEVYARAPLQALGEAARAVRRRFNPQEQVTYLVDRNVNYTNVCITDCKFCAFYRPPGHAEAYVLTREVLHEKLSELRALGGTRVLLQGGHHPKLRLAWYEELLSWMKASFQELEIDGFSPSEIQHIAALEELGIRETLLRLKKAGLDGVPGGGAEILDDEIRRQVSPKKISSAAWLAVMEEAHKLGLYTSASQVIGFGETAHHRLAALQRIRQQQDRSLKLHGLGFLAFVAWPLLHESRFGEVFGRIKGRKLGANSAEYLRHMAFCRCFLDNIPHLQASWPTMGLQTAAESLRFGCDDMGGTMMEENVVSQAGSMHCSATEAELRQAVEAAGLAPIKRDSWYRLLEVSA